jgi:Protein of unknown function (DUF2799)
MQFSNFLILTIAFAGVVGCAPISRESCINDSAYDIGYAAAMDNADRVNRLQSVSKICGKEGREVDVAGYSEGFDAGTDAFCVVDNGYRWGLRGRGYNGVCQDPAFGAAYDDGLRIYKIQQRGKAIRDRLETIRSRVANIQRLLDEDKTLTEERRRKLSREWDGLLLERRDLLAEQQSLPAV